MDYYPGNFVLLFITRLYKGNEAWRGIYATGSFGVMVFQEDVIKITHYYAGLSLGQCDIVRRAMSGKYRSQNEFDMIMSGFFEVL